MMRRSVGACVGLLAISASLASAQTAPSDATPKTIATPTPAPVKSAAPSDIKFSGTLRAYDFARQNAVQNAGNPNRSAFSAGGGINADYQLPGTDLHLGATYYGAYGFGLNGPNPENNPKIDNTLPGSSLSTFAETYLRYKAGHFTTTLGDQIVNEKWAPNSDSRIKPSAFQGLSASYKFGRNLTIGASRMVAFEGRTASDFERTTLLTSRPEGNPAYPKRYSAGFLLANAAYANKNVSALVENYSFYDIANLSYVEARAGLASFAKPYVAVQYVNENQAGRALAGRIHSDTYGVQIGANPTKTLQIAASFDDSPQRYEIVSAASAAAAGRAFFTPVGGTGAVAALGNGTYRVATGGIASPYSEAYATDPIFTTSISQGVVDRHSAGRSYKLAATYTTANNRFKGILSRAFYEYSNAIAKNTTYETDVDMTYYVSPVKKGPYRGLLLRERFADRQQPTLPFDFTYIRTQLQYQF